MGRLARVRVSLRIVIPTVIPVGIGPADLRMGDDAIASRATKVLERLPAVTLHRVGHARCQLFDDVRTYRMVEHRGRADLHGAASEEEIIQRVAEFRNAADA